MRRLIITGDDFGLAVQVNEAIEQAHRQGILTTASLMVGAKATEDAVKRARELPSLRVGLHLVLVDGSAVLPLQTIPDLVDRKGAFSARLVRAGINFFFRPGIRQQLEAEIRAQFQAFDKTGLPLDHVNTHHHMHLHPTVLRLILKVGQGYGIRAMRLPYEPLISSWQVSRKAFLPKLAAWVFLSPWLALLKSRLRRANVRSNEFVFGMNDSGNMHVDLLHRILGHLPQGVTEVYFHPATGRCPEIGRIASNHNPEAELEALTSPEMRQALVEFGVERIAFSDL